MVAMLTGGLAAMTVPADASGAGRELHTRTALLPLAIDSQRLQVRSGPPALGEHGVALLGGLGYSADQIAQLLAEGVVGAAAAQATHTAG